MRIGALARQRAAELSDLVRTEAPLFAEAGGHVAHPSVRRRGTVVGSIAFADPSAELPAALLALDGEAIVSGPTASGPSPRRTSSPARSRRASPPAS